MTRAYLSVDLSPSNRLEWKTVPPRNKGSSKEEQFGIARGGAGPPSMHEGAKKDLKFPLTRRVFWVEREDSDDMKFHGTDTAHGGRTKISLLRASTAPWICQS